MHKTRHNRPITGLAGGWIAATGIARCVLLRHWHIKSPAIETCPDGALELSLSPRDARTRGARSRSRHPRTRRSVALARSWHAGHPLWLVSSEQPTLDAAWVRWEERRGAAADLVWRSKFGRAANHASSAAWDQDFDTTKYRVLRKILFHDWMRPVPALLALFASCECSAKAALGPEFERWPALGMGKLPSPGWCGAPSPFTVHRPPRGSTIPCTEHMRPSHPPGMVPTTKDAMCLFVLEVSPCKILATQSITTVFAD